MRYESFDFFPCASEFHHRRWNR